MSSSNQKHLTKIIRARKTSKCYREQKKGLKATNVTSLFPTLLLVFSVRANEDGERRAFHTPVLGDTSLERGSSDVSTSISEADLGHSRKKQKRKLIFLKQKWAKEGGSFPPAGKG